MIDLIVFTFVVALLALGVWMLVQEWRSDGW